MKETVQLGLDEKLVLFSIYQEYHLLDIIYHSPSLLDIDIYLLYGKASGPI